MNPSLPFRSHRLALGLAFGVAGSAVAADTVEPLKGKVVNVWFENDLVVRTDRHYTSGSRIGYLAAEQSWETHPDSWMGTVAGWLPAPWQDTSAWRAGISLTQNIYTPRSTKVQTLIPDDRPYAGWLFLTPSIQLRGLTSGHTPVLEVWSATIGVVGPASLAQEAQNFVHDVRGVPDAKGWDNELKNEPDLGIRCAKAFRYTAPIHGLFAGQFIPHAGVQAGTVQSYASLGAQWRVGIRLPDDFGWRSIDEIVPVSGGRASRAHRGCYFYLAAEGRAFANNMLLDGNLYHDSHSVVKTPLVGDIRIGVVYVGKRWELAYTHSIRSKEFRLQQDVDSFGSISASFNW